MASRASSGLLVKQVHHLWSGTWTTVFATFILRTLLLYCVSDELCVCIRASQLIFRPSNMHPLHFVRPSSRRATAAILFFSFLVIFLSACDCSSTIMISSARLPSTSPSAVAALPSQYSIRNQGAARCRVPQYGTRAPRGAGCRGAPQCDNSQIS